MIPYSTDRHNPLKIVNRGDHPRLLVCESSFIILVLYIYTYFIVCVCVCVCVYVCVRVCVRARDINARPLDRDECFQIRSSISVIVLDLPV